MSRHESASAPVVLISGLVVATALAVSSCKKEAQSAAPSFANTAQIERMDDDLDQALALLEQNEEAFSAMGYAVGTDYRGQGDAPAGPGVVGGASDNGPGERTGAEIAEGADETVALPTEEDSPEPAASPSRDFAGPPPDSEEGRRAGRRDLGDSDATIDCSVLCELTSATCQLEARICDMATRHVGDPRYENACDRATNDCSQATEIAASSCTCEGT